MSIHVWMPFSTYQCFVKCVYSMCTNVWSFPSCFTDTLLRYFVGMRSFRRERNGMQSIPILPFDADNYVQDELHTRLRLFDLVEELYRDELLSQMLQANRGKLSTSKVKRMEREVYLAMCKAQKIFRHIYGVFLRFVRVSSLDIFLRLSSSSCSS